MTLIAALMLAATAPTGTPAASSTYVPSFDPSGLKDNVGGPPGEVLVLGTPHLSSFPKNFQAENLGPLLDRLAAWRPQMIAIEAVSGAQCEMLLRYASVYPDAYKSYCWNPEPAREATGLDVPAATAEAEKLLATWPENPTAAQRRRLAAVFLAGGEQASAVVQWLQLPIAERQPGEGLNDLLVERLNELVSRRNENYLIGAALAARLGLQRVHSVDDHSADFSSESSEDEAAYGTAVQRAWDNPATAKRRAIDDELMKRLDGEGVLAIYRDYNSEHSMRLIFESDFGAAVAGVSPKNHTRRYSGWWETRNLRMVANIRRAMARQPGTRMLAIVGASHKGYYEAYLHMMHDINLVDAEAMLK
ncbi:DUF5694 domain-containing protein [Sphingopyxis kveilinensis]|uniref:DUF5694 domain-containing protein n=1 Tax=Sphingopyxis kveilinensis TaxID=3114367 RepID=UPI0030D148C1